MLKCRALGTVSAAYLPILLLNGLLGIADSFREPASMALFADEGAGEGITSSFGIRSMVWPGALLAPLVGGYSLAIRGTRCQSGEISSMSTSPQRISNCR